MDIAIMERDDRERRRLGQLLRELLKGAGMEGRLHLFAEGGGLLKAHRPGRFALVLLEQGEGADGIAVARCLRERGDRCRVILMSPDTAAALSGYEVEAVGYLLKPVERAGLEQTLRRCLRSLPRSGEYVEVMVSRTPVRLPLRHILWIETRQNTLYLHTDSGPYKTYMTFQRLCGLLEGEERFLVCYKGCLVNMDRVAGIERYDFRMDNGDLVQIRKRGAAKVRQLYMEYRTRKSAEAL